MGTSLRVVGQGLGWAAAAALLALLVMTNCNSVEVLERIECGPNGVCPTGYLCDPPSNLCLIGDTTCSDGNVKSCPDNKTCYPPTGPGECVAPAQIACGAVLPGDQVCSTGICSPGLACRPITVKGTSGSVHQECGCVPQPAK